MNLRTVMDDIAGASFATAEEAVMAWLRSPVAPQTAPVGRAVRHLAERNDLTWDHLAAMQFVRERGRPPLGIADEERDAMMWRDALVVLAPYLRMHGILRD